MFATADRWGRRGNGTWRHSTGGKRRLLSSQPGTPFPAGDTLGSSPFLDPGRTGPSPANSFTNQYSPGFSRHEKVTPRDAIPGGLLLLAALGTASFCTGRNRPDLPHTQDPRFCRRAYIFVREVIVPYALMTAN